MPKSQVRKALALSLKPTSWILALCLAMAHTFLRNVDRKVSLKRMTADRMMVSASRGEKRNSISQMVAPDLLLGVRGQRPL